MGCLASNYSLNLQVRSFLTVIGAGLVLWWVLPPLPVFAQTTILPTQPLTFEECLRKFEELGKQAREAGDKAWQIASEGAVKGLKGWYEKAQVWYDRAKELRNLAYALRCIRGSDQGERSNKQQIVARVLRGMTEMGVSGLRSTPAAIRGYIRAQLRNVQDHNNFLMDKVAEIERKMGLIGPSPSPQPQAGTPTPSSLQQDLLIEPSAAASWSADTTANATSPPPSREALADFQCMRAYNTSLCKYEQGHPLPGRRVTSHSFADWHLECNLVNGEIVMFALGDETYLHGPRGLIIKIYRECLDMIRQGIIR